MNKIKCPVCGANVSVMSQKSDASKKILTVHPSPARDRICYGSYTPAIEKPQRKRGLGISNLNDYYGGDENDQ